MLSLRKEIIQSYQRRGTDTYEKISEEDLARLQKARSKMYVWPAISLLTTYGIGWLLGRLDIGGMLNNHLLEDESLEAERKALRRIKFSGLMKKQGLLIVGFTSTYFTYSGGFLGWCYYYGVKYSLFLKYENLVNSYARAATEDFLNKESAGKQVVQVPF